MNTKKKVLIVSVLLIGGGVFYLYKNMKKNKAVVASQNPENPENAETPKAKIDIQKVLGVGSTGEEVKRLQTALKGGLVADGVFGALTEKRLKAVTGKTSITLSDYNNYIQVKNFNSILAPTKTNFF